MSMARLLPPRPEPRDDGAGYVVLACAVILLFLAVAAWAVGQLVG